jgi:hypothetical protein
LRFLLLDLLKQYSKLFQQSSCQKKHISRVMTKPT